MDRRRQQLVVPCFLLANLLKFAASQDDVALLQHSLAPHAEVGEMADMDHMLQDTTVRNTMMKAPQLFEKMTKTATPAKIDETITAGKQFTVGFHKAVSKAWKSFSRRSRGSNPDPQTLLHNGKLALLETGAFQEMRKLARAAANASKANGIYLGAVPLDSMMVGFRTSVAPWNNILKLFKIPLIKSQFTIFTNFFGPDGNAARLCIGAATAVDSKYGKHARSEFSGINIFIGPAKWDNIPGWSFGSSGGYDNLRIMDVADFAWTWTLAREPETVCFFYDVCIVDDEELHSNMLQTDSQVETADPQPPVNIATLERHGSTWLQHIWCSPDWFNTPLVLPDDSSSGTTMDEKSSESSEQGSAPYFKAQAEEEWDPESEAV